MLGFLDRLFGGEKGPTVRVVIEHEVLDDLLGGAKKAHPREFAALLEGGLEQEVLRVEGFVLPRAYLGKDNVLMKIGMLPPMIETIGSAHSHPGSNPYPSRADVHFFEKRGLVHFIMANPYSRKDVKAYDRLGREIEFSIG